MNRKLPQPAHIFPLGMHTRSFEDSIVRWLDNRNILISGYDWCTILDTVTDQDLPLFRVDGYNVDGCNNFLVASRRILVNDDDPDNYQIADSDVLASMRLIETYDIKNFKLELVNRTKYSGGVLVAISKTTPHHVVAHQDQLLIQSIDSHNTLKTINCSESRSIEFTPNGQYLLVLDLDFCLTVFETQGWKKIWRSDDDDDIIHEHCIGHHPPTNSLLYAVSRYQYTRDGFNLEGVDIREVQLSEGVERTLQEDIGGYDEKIRALTCSADGNFMSVALDNRAPQFGGRRGRMLLWKMPDLDLVWAERFSYSMDPLPLFVAFSPDSNKLAASCENTEIRIWEMSTREMSPSDDIAITPTIDSSSLMSEYSRIKEMKPRERGRAFQGLLKTIFDSEGIGSSDPFRPEGEEIDGSFFLFERTFLIEAKWVSNPVPESEVLRFRGKVEGKIAGTLGIFWSISGYSSKCVGALERGKNINTLLFDKEDLEAILHGEVTFRELLLFKYRLAGMKGVSYQSWSKFQK